MFNLGDFLRIKIFEFDLIQLFSIISLNIYFKKKISLLPSPSLSLIDKFFNYCVLAFTGAILLGSYNFCFDHIML